MLLKEIGIKSSEYAYDKSLVESWDNLIPASRVYEPDYSSTTEKNAGLNISSYKNNLEEEVETMLEKIDGVGRVEVMITFSGTEEYIFAEEIKASKSDKFSSQMQNEFVLIEKNGEKEALISKVNNPQISGVVVVCDGGDSDKVCESVYRTVSTVLGIPTKNIYVTKLK